MFVTETTSSLFYDSDFYQNIVMEEEKIPIVLVN